MPEQLDNAQGSSKGSKFDFGEGGLDTGRVLAETPGSDKANDPLNYKVSQAYNDQPNTLVFCNLNDGTCSFPQKVSESGTTEPLTFTNDIFDQVDRDGNKELSSKEVTSLGEKLKLMGKSQEEGIKTKTIKSNVKEYQEMTDLVINSFDDITKLDKTDGAAGENAEGITKKDIEAFKKLQEKDPSSLTKEESALLNKLKGGDKKPADKKTPSLKSLFGRG